MKKLILDIHKSMLMDRGLDEVKYIVRTTNDFLDTKKTKQRPAHNMRTDRCFICCSLYQPQFTTTPLQYLHTVASIAISSLQ